MHGVACEPQQTTSIKALIDLVIKKQIKAIGKP